MIKKWMYVLLLMPFLLVACGEEKTGPVPIKIGRDMCERCRMIITDVKFVAEVRGGPEMDIWKFDDIGDAVTWLNAKPWAGEEKTEIWVMNYATGDEWLDARKAHFVPNFMSPMAYGFAAFKAPQEKGMSFKDMAEKVLKEKVMINCDPLNPNHS